MPKVKKGILKKYSLRRKTHCTFKQYVRVCKFEKHRTTEELGRRVSNKQFEEVKLKV